MVNVTRQGNEDPGTDYGEKGPVRETSKKRSKCLVLIRIIPVTDLGLTCPEDPSV